MDKTREFIQDFLCFQGFLVQFPLMGHSQFIQFFINITLPRCIAVRHAHHIVQSLKVFELLAELSFTYIIPNNIYGENYKIEEKYINYRYIGMPLSNKPINNMELLKRKNNKIIGTFSF